MEGKGLQSHKGFDGSTRVISHCAHANSTMEVVGLAFSVVGLAGPLATVCMRGYDLLCSTIVAPQDADDFHLRINTEMGLLSLWTKHWVDPRTGQIRGGAGREEVCFLAVDILGKIGTLLVDMEKLQGKYGIEMKNRVEEIEYQATNIGGLDKGNKSGSEPVISKTPIAGGVAVSVCAVDSTAGSVSLPGDPAKDGCAGVGNAGKKKSWLRQLKGKFRALMSTPAPKLQGVGLVATTTPESATPANPDDGSTTEVSCPGKPSAKLALDVTHAPVEEVFATLDSTRAEVEAKLTIVQRMKWVIKDQERVTGLMNELKGWNEKLFMLLPLPRLNPNSPRRNRHYSIPHRASPIFTGREAAMSVLEEAFFGRTAEEQDSVDDHDIDTVDRQRRAVLYGLGGTGKTQIALKFAEDKRDRFDSIFWIDASSTETVEQCFQDVALLLRLPIGNNEAFIRSVKHQLAQMRNKRWLLIFDNADDISLVPYLPQGNHGCILITTRNPRAKRYLGPLDQQAYHVEEMTPDEAVELLLRAAGLLHGLSRVADIDAESLDHSHKIVKTLGYLALAIDQAGAYISNTASLDTYLEIYGSFRTELLYIGESEPTGYAYPVYKTWEISFEMVTKKSSAAAELLQIFGYLHYERIPCLIFENASVGPGSAEADGHPVVLPALGDLLNRCFTTDDSGATKWKSFHLDNAITQLTNYSLVKKHAPAIERDMPLTYSMHPLVHSWIRERNIVGEDQKLTVQTSTVSLLRSAILGVSGPTAYAMRSRLVVHIDAWVYPNLEKAPVSVLGPTERSQVRTLDALAIVYHEVGRLSIAIQLRERILEWRKDNLSPPYHEDIIRARTELATTYRRATISLPKALKLDRETLELLCSSKGCGPDHPLTQTAKLSLGATLAESGDPKGCEQLEREVLEARIRLLGDDHLDVATTRNSLAVTLFRLHRYPSAEVLVRAALTRRLSVLGEKDPRTLLCMSNLAGATRGQGRHEEALELEKRVLDTRVSLLGEQHQDVAKAKANYGYSLMTIGRLEESLQYEQDALDQFEETLGSYHVYTMDAIGTIGEVYLKMIEKNHDPELLERTESLLTDLVERKKLVFGDTHTSTEFAVKLLAKFHEKLENLIKD